VCVLTIVAVDLIVTVRRARDERALDETVQALKQRARAQDERLRQETYVGVDEAQQRMEQLGIGVSWIMSYLVATLPDDFAE